MYLLWRDPYTIMLMALALLLPVLAATAVRRAVKRHPVMTRGFKWLVIGAAILLAGCAYLTVGMIQGNPARELLADAPAIALRLADGRAVPLSDLRGKVVLLDFWATWCPPCRASSPAVSRLAADFGPRGLVVVGVSADEDEGAWRRYIAPHGGGRMEALDSRDEVARVFQAAAKPTFVLIDRQGRMRWRMRAWTPWSYPRMRSRVAKLLEE
jgi:thiol-disulfide isomerase/thioredoxin